jgi:predicted transcriptional regulator
MKTLAIRLDDDLHALLSVLAQLRESSVTEEIRLAIESHLRSQQDNPELSGRAQAVLEEIERDSQTRQAAIATLFGSAEQHSDTSGNGTTSSSSGSSTNSAGGTSATGSSSSTGSANSNDAKQTTTATKASSSKASS